MMVSFSRFCQANDLFELHQGIIRLPLLVRGQLRLPPPREQRDQGLLVEGRQWSYLLPRWTSLEVLPQPPVRGLTRQTVAELLRLWKNALEANRAFLDTVADLAVDNSGLGEAFTRQSFLDLESDLSPEAALAMTDQEIGWDYLESWVAQPPAWDIGATRALSKSINPTPDRQLSQPYLKAFGTRQLHICAGNAPAIPWITALRLALTLSCGVIKAPHQALESASLLALTAALISPGLPLIQDLSVVYWPGGDPEWEDALFLPFRFDRTIVWGGPEAVAAVSRRVTTGRLIPFGPRYSVAVVGGQALTDPLTPSRSTTDSLVYNQNACNAALIHYVVGTLEEVRAYARTVGEVLAAWDRQVPPPIEERSLGAFQRLRLGIGRDWEWLTDTQRRGQTNLVIVKGSLDLNFHPGGRLIIVRPLDRVADLLPYLSPAVSVCTVGDETLRLLWRDEILARGVSAVLPLGEAERAFPGAPQDGARVLSELVDWKQS